MRILMTTEPMGGIWAYALELGRGLSNLGHETILAVLGPAPSSIQWAEAERIQGMEVRVKPGKLEWMDDPWGDVDDAGSWLLDIAGKARVDVVHLNGYALGGLPWGCPVLVAGHSCRVSWWRACKGAEAPSSLWEYRRRVSSGLQGADLVVAPSHSMLEALKGNYAFSTPVCTISNGRAVSRFTPRQKEPFILAAGRLWDEAKNLDVLDRAAAWLPWPVYVAGEKTGPTGREKAFRKLRTLARLSTMEMGQWMGRASIFAQPSRFESFGLAALEAARSGCALVLGDIPSLREIWGTAAEYAPPEDSEALAAALLALIRNDGRRQRLAHTAKMRSRLFSADVMAQAYAATYSRMLNPLASAGTAHEGS